MKKTILFTAGFFVIICAVFFATSPDVLSMGVVGVMSVAIALGFIFGILPNLLFCSGFRKGRKEIDNINKISVRNKWTAVRQTKDFFGQKTLNVFFDYYIKKTKEQQENGMVLSDIEDVINEDSLALRSWRGVVIQIAGTLTALGLLGTFLGLITGISGVAFSTFDATVASIETLLHGIATAFYTSIVGVILSVIFNVVNRIIWNYTLREMNLFNEKFHSDIQPAAEEQVRAKSIANSEEIIKLLSQINYSESRNNNTIHKDVSYEQRLMIQLTSGIREGEISTVYEPVCNLDKRNIISAGCFPKWVHKTLGIIHPCVYLPVIRANGYIVKLEQFIWNDVCASLKKAKEENKRIVPAALPVSKVTLMSLDLERYADDLIEKYDLSPRDLEWSLESDAYTTCHTEALKAEQALIKKGFHVSVNSFNGNFIELGETEADELILDLKNIGEEQLENIFDQAAQKKLTITAANVTVPKQLVTLRKLGCTIGRGEQLYEECDFSDLTDLLNSDKM